MPSGLEEQYGPLHEASVFENAPPHRLRLFGNLSKSINPRSISIIPESHPQLGRDFASTNVKILFCKVNQLGLSSSIREKARTKPCFGPPHQDPSTSALFTTRTPGRWRATLKILFRRGCSGDSGSAFREDRITLLALERFFPESNASIGESSLFCNICRFPTQMCYTSGHLWRDRGALDKPKPRHCQA